MLFYGAIFRKVISKTTRQRCSCIVNVRIIFVFREVLSKWTYKFINYIGMVYVYFSELVLFLMIRFKIYIYIYIYVVNSIRFQTFFVEEFKIVIDSWKFSMLLLYIIWDDGPIFMISGLNEQLQQQLEYTLLKPNCYYWWISKMQSRPKNTLEERYTIKLCSKLGKKVTETYGMLQTAFRQSCINRTSVFEKCYVG